MNHLAFFAFRGQPVTVLLDSPLSPRPARNCCRHLGIEAKTIATTNLAFHVSTEGPFIGYLVEIFVSIFIRPNQAVKYFRSAKLVAVFFSLYSNTVVSVVSTADIRGVAIGRDVAVFNTQRCLPGNRPLPLLHIHSEIHNHTRL